MDASLRTLELMASEVGGTVMILREVVLSAHSPIRDSPICSDVSSSAISLSSSAYSTQEGGDMYRWPVKRPDLDGNGLPRRGSKSLNGVAAPSSTGKLGKKPSRDYVASQQIRAGKQFIFDPQDLKDADTDEDESPISAAVGEASRRCRSNTDEDVPPFHLDLEDAVLGSGDSVASGTSRLNDGLREMRTTFTTPPKTKIRHSSTKRLKMAKKREARRMDLLRGDGTNPLWTDLQTTNEAGEAIAPTSISPSAVLTKVPNQPTRPSSLRLASPAVESNARHRADANNDDEESLWSLSQLPLDSLSLSFANVQIENISPPSSPSSETEYAMPLYDDPSEWHSANGPRPLSGEEMICVEALVVRKVQHGHGADGDGTDEEVCGWGGEDDGWGFGVDSD